MAQALPSPVLGRWAARTARRDETKRRITGTAQLLFIDRGYLATTMGDIAVEAGVAVQTLYLAMGSKVQILSAVIDRAVAGDDEPVPLLERTWVRQLESERNGSKAVDFLAQEGAQVVARVAPVYSRTQEAAADPEVAELLATARHQRFEVMRAVATIISRKEGFARSLSVGGAADLLYAVLSEESYRLLCVDRGWPLRKWQRWVAGTLKRAYFPDMGASHR